MAVSHFSPARQSRPGSGWATQLSSWASLKFTSDTLNWAERAIRISSWIFKKWLCKNGTLEQLSVESLLCVHLAEYKLTLSLFCIQKILIHPVFKACGDNIYIFFVLKCFFLTIIRDRFEVWILFFKYIRWQNRKLTTLSYDPPNCCQFIQSKNLETSLYNRTSLGVPHGLTSSYLSSCFRRHSLNMPTSHVFSPLLVFLLHWIFLFLSLPHIILLHWVLLQVSHIKLAPYIHGPVPFYLYNINEIIFYL